ncbi:MAG: Pycsar system effector family protein [Saprospiraceae bacterium]
MTESKNKLLVAAEAFITNFFKNRIGAEYVFHDFNHTSNVVQSVLEISAHYNLTAKQLEILQLSAWFHDTGYEQGRENHEQRGCENLKRFLHPYDYAEEDSQQIEACIMATAIPQRPNNLLEEIICDADLSHLGKDIYWDRCGRVRQELLMTRSVVMSEQEWVEFELEFMNNHKYHTSVAEKLYGKNKERHIRQLLKQQSRLNPALESMDDLAERDKKKKKKKKKKLKAAMRGDASEIKDIRLGRGVETMYRTTYRTHVNLSSIADNKANIMLSINAIIISIILSTMVPKFAVNPSLVVPTLVLLTVCLTAMVFAVLSTRPKITEGKFTREDIEHKRSNLLFFGNFYNMQLNDFEWGMNEMIRDSDFLYSSMTRDLYFLGIVLAKKYRYLSYCYNVFMYGLIIATITFGIAFAL